jgi:hypothetical protein
MGRWLVSTNAAFDVFQELAGGFRTQDHSRRRELDTGVDAFVTGR